MNQSLQETSWSRDDSTVYQLAFNAWLVAGLRFSAVFEFWKRARVKRVCFVLGAEGPIVCRVLREGAGWDFGVALLAPQVWSGWSPSSSTIFLYFEVSRRLSCRSPLIWQQEGYTSPLGGQKITRIRKEVVNCSTLVLSTCTLFQCWIDCVQCEL